MTILAHGTIAPANDDSHTIGMRDFHFARIDDDSVFGLVQGCESAVGLGTPAVGPGQCSQLVSGFA